MHGDVVGPVPRGYGPQGVAALHRPRRADVSAGARRRRLRCARQTRVRLQLGRIFGNGRHCRRPRNRCVRNVCLRDPRLGRLDRAGRSWPRQQQRRIEQHCVLAQKAAARPGRFDEHCNERLGNGPPGADEHNVGAIVATTNAELECRQERGADRDRSARTFPDSPE